MGHFAYREGELHADGVPLSRVAEQFGTPSYVYSRRAIEQAWRAYDEAMNPHPHLICYAVKANSNLAVLNVLARLHCGFDIVSGGELERVLRAGGDPAKVVFSGVGKTEAEIERAVAVGIKCFNIESIAELERVEKCARGQGKTASISIRVNPNIDSFTHPYIATGLRENKFGIDYERALEAYEVAAGFKYIRVAGVDCHIGSQIENLRPFVAAVEHMMELVRALEKKGITLQHIDVGGGLAVPYRDEQVPAVERYAAAVLTAVAEQKYEIIVEPGRSIVAEAGVLLTRVEYIKHTDEHDFAIVDAGMNDLMRPALYDGWHDVLRVYQASEAQPRSYDLVGPLCESGDFLARGRSLALRQGDLLALTTVGAYGFAMSSNYNTRPRVCEIMIDGNHSHQVRRRESLEDLVAGETLLPA